MKTFLKMDGSNLGDAHTCCNGAEKNNNNNL